MQKVYLLLRNNQQTGPFNLEELIRFDLKPYDLIWIEGKSAGWYYPQEIKELHSHLPFLKQATPQPVTANLIEAKSPAATSAQPGKVFVSMPAFSKEESTPKPSFAKVSTAQDEKSKFSEPVQPKKEAGEIKTSDSKSVEEVETDYMNRMYQKKTKKKSFISIKGTIAACLVAGLAAAAWLMMKPSEETAKNVSTEQTSFIPAQNQLDVDSTMGNENLTQNTTTSFNKEKKNKTTIVEKKPAPVVKTSSPKKQGEEIVVNTSSTENNEYESAPPVVKEESKTVIEEKKEPVIAEAPREQKKLRDKFLDLFKKKPQEKADDAKPIEEEDGKRNSTRRETGSNLAQMVTVKIAIPNDWMMGIKGAKATLTNRSSEVIAKAVVEMVYYNDDNDVLDKKTITFSDIKSKQTKTVGVPNHSTATRLEYNVVSATGSEPFARL